MEIRIAAGDIIIADFGQIYHRVCSERSSAATASISTPGGSFNSAPRYWICSISSGTGAAGQLHQLRSGCFRHLTAQLPEPVIETFLGDPSLLTKLPFCQSTVVTLLDEHSPGLRPVFIPHCQYICHLIAPLQPSRKTHRAFFEFWDIIS